MQIRINLDDIFKSSGLDDSEDTSINKSYQYSEVKSYSSNNNRQKMNFNHFPFDDDENDPTPQKKSPKAPSPPESKSSSVLSSSLQTEFSEKLPGERLYYESVNNGLRKTKQIERLRQEKERQEDKQITFKPQINKNSQKLAKVKKQALPKKQSEKILPTMVQKQREELLHCTFKPELVAKPKASTYRSKEQGEIFDQLFNDSKLKQVKQKLKTEGVDKDREKAKKLTKAQLDSFLTRSNEYMNKVEKKKEMIFQKSRWFDLKTGQKMFSPKTNTFKLHKNYFGNSQSETKLKPNTNPIFSKNYDSPPTIPTPKSLFNKHTENPDSKLDSIFKFKQSNKLFSEIHQAKQDQQEEGIRETAHIEEVKRFYFKKSDPHQNNLDLDYEPHFGSVNEDEGRRYLQPQENQEEVEHATHQQYQDQVEEEVEEEHYLQESDEDDEVEEQGQIQMMENQSKHSEEGRTHHQGDETPEEH